MNLEKLRDHAALAAFQALLQRNGDDDVAVIAHGAWKAADAFIDQRPLRKCDDCPHQIADQAGYVNVNTGAGPACS